MLTAQERWNGLNVSLGGLIPIDLVGFGTRVESMPAGALVVRVADLMDAGSALRFPRTHGTEHNGIVKYLWQQQLANGVKEMFSYSHCAKECVVVLTPSVQWRLCPFPCSRSQRATVRETCSGWHLERAAC